ncbi:nucleotidyltransferase domain-containing protein [Peribacillus sp. NPDC097675]|uniref:nucleotidyltransferase domain-containing protein n=1 Tax=Peribacillus sp. NPDC097675 TaxID=3390618 RepID=UPI003D08DA5A
MKENLISQLLKLEKQENITILVAAVTGSHSFGLSSSNSDSDVRFIYVHNEVRSYLSISKPVDLIQMDEGSLDFVGWDLFKASRLLLKSNPSLYELFKSPIQLISQLDYYRNMLDLIDRTYSKKVLGHHYFRMLCGNLQRLSENEDSEVKELKTWVQVYRSYVTLHYLIQKESLPPINVWNLKDSILLEEATNKWMTDIFMAKKNGHYLKIESEENLNFLKGTLPFLKAKLANLPIGADMEQELNQINWTILKEEMGKWDI